MTSVSSKVKFSSLFTQSQVLCNIESDQRDLAIMELLRKLAYEHGVGNVSEVFDEIIKRETDMSTVISPGIAIPHARIASVNELVVGVATSKSGVEWTDKSPVKVIILLLIPKEQPGLYLQAISALASICSTPDSADTISDLTSSDELWRYFDRGGLILPDYICAGDVMREVEVKLYENDTLEKAIDYFVKYNYLSLPVVDINNELIGVVSAQELLRVVLPDYILWMDDLSPILNFEPFAEILRRENMTWLAEIMTTEVPSIQITAPAVQIAKEMTRINATRVYVLEGKKLKGVISLRGFLSKVLRE